MKYGLTMHNKWSQDTYLNAYWFAAKAHVDQRYPGTQISYIMHLSFVTMEVIAALHQEASTLDADFAVQCALLHDVIEDTDVTYQDLLLHFGSDVADAVQALTKDLSLPTKAEQMRDSLHRIRLQPKEVWMVKLADRISNLQPPPHYWSESKCCAYLLEAQEIYDALHTASPVLAARLHEKIQNYSMPHSMGNS
jgi:(p)ppGpp synthase/HD superfamily hydrolase